MSKPVNAFRVADSAIYTGLVLPWHYDETVGAYWARACGLSLWVQFYAESHGPQEGAEPGWYWSLEEENKPSTRAPSGFDAQQRAERRAFEIVSETHERLFERYGDVSGSNSGDFTRL